MNNNRKDISGQRFGYLTAIRPAAERYQKQGRSRLWLCRCDCGLHLLVQLVDLTGGTARQCSICGGVSKQSRFVRLVPKGDDRA